MDDCLIACKSKDIIAAFKGKILTRFIGTDEGEVTEYLGCKLIRDRSAKTTNMGTYSERVLKIVGMWDCKPYATPLDANGELLHGCGPCLSSPLPQHYWMLVIFGERDEARSLVCIFPVEQVSTISTIWHN